MNGKMILTLCANYTYLQSANPKHCIKEECEADSGLSNKDAIDW